MGLVNLSSCLPDLLGDNPNWSRQNRIVDSGSFVSQAANHASHSLILGIVLRPRPRKMLIRHLEI